MVVHYNYPHGSSLSHTVQPKSNSAPRQRFCNRDPYPLPFMTVYSRQYTHAGHSRHDHRRSRQPLDAASPSSPMVLAPSPAVVKSSRRAGHEGSRGGSREHISVQPLAPASRRASQQRQERESALISQHPYAAANTQSGYRNTALERNSPVQNGIGPLPNSGGSPAVPNASDSFMCVFAEEYTHPHTSSSLMPFSDAQHFFDDDTFAGNNRRY